MFTHDLPGNGRWANLIGRGRKKVAIPLGLGFEMGRDPGWLVPRDPGLWVEIPLGFDLVNQKLGDGLARAD